MTTLSVIIPAYNAAETIGAALSSLAGDYGFPLEVIVSDDGSPDGTAEAAEEAAKEAGLTDFRVLRCAHRGVSAARNAALSAAEGRWILFADADDLVLMREIAGILKRSDGLEDFILFSYVNVSEDGREEKAEATLPDGIYRDRAVLDDLADRLMDHPFARRAKTRYMPGSVIRSLFAARFLKDNGIAFREEIHFGEDCLFMYRCFLAAKYVAIDRTVAYRRLVRTDSASRAYRPRHWEEFKELLACIGEENGGQPERAAQFLYHNGVYVMGKAVRHFGPGNPAGAREVIREVLNDPQFSSALASLPFRDWTPAERIHNYAAAHQCYRLYWWLWILHARPGR